MTRAALVGFILLTGTLLTEAVQAQTAPPPGVVIDRSSDPQRVFIGSPSLAVLPDGSYVASHDFFGPGTTFDRTIVFGSKDRGKTWQHRSDVDGQFWSSLFVHRGALYLFGTSRRYGQIVIRRSTDGGKTWTTPKDAESGRLTFEGKYHCAPVPVVVHDGRIWRAFEDQTGRWGTGFRSLVLSAAVDADLLKASDWTVSNRLSFGDWPPYGGWLEGNVVVTPEGRLVNILRVHETVSGGKAAVVQISDDGRTLSFDPKHGFIDFPGGCKKFTIRRDPATGRYWSLVNWIPDRYRGHNAERTRNTLALVASDDLRAWEVRAVVLEHPDVATVGFQYVDWLFEGDDLIAVSRTAWGGARNCHDANYLTFHRIEGFRTLTGRVD